MAKQGYHHGNLREALIVACLRLVEEKGPTGFTLSEAARVAGVTPAAVYRHFAGRDDLIAEAKISPADISFITLDQEASVKIDAYDSSIFGSANGRVSYISPDTLTEQKPSGEQVFYRVHIRVDTKAMRPRVDQSIEIQPGMTATTEILTGYNTVLKYLLKPLIKTVEQSFGER